jgi:hypothetical protein
VYLVSPADDEELALTINGKKKSIRLSDFDVLARNMNIPETAVRNTHKKFSSSNKQIEEMIKLSFLSSKKKKYICKFGIKSRGYSINMLLLQVKDNLRIVELVKFFVLNIFLQNEWNTYPRLFNPINTEILNFCTTSQISLNQKILRKLNLRIFAK